MSFACSADTSYCVQSEMELLYNTCEMVFAARLMDVDLDEIHDNMEGDILQNFSRQYHIWYDQIATPIEKSLIGYYFIHNSHYQLQDFVKIINDRLVDSFALSQKIALPFASRKNTLIEIANSKNIFSKSNIFSIIQKDPKLLVFATIFHSKLALYINNITHSFSESVSYFYNKYEKKTSIDLFRDIFDAIEDVEIKKNVDKKIKKKVRRIFNKSMLGLQSFFGQQNTKSFIRGESVFVEGNLFNYELKKSMSLMTYTQKIDSIHIPYDLSILTKDNKYITKMCVVFPGSPVLDQVLSLYLMIKSGKEKELLETGNFYGNRGEEYYKDPTFIKMFNSKKPVLNEFTNQENRTSIDVCSTELALYFIDQSDPIRQNIINESKILERNIKTRNPRAKEKIFNLFFTYSNIGKGLLEALKSQELAWDEIMDYISLSIPLPTYIDYAIDIKNGPSTFNQLFSETRIDFVDQIVKISEKSPKILFKNFNSV